MTVLQSQQADKLTKTTKQQPARKMKLNRFAATLFGLLWVAFALNWTHIYRVHQRLDSEEFLGFNPDDLPTKRDKALYRKEGAYWEEQDDKSNQEDSKDQIIDPRTIIEEARNKRPVLTEDAAKSKFSKSQSLFQQKHQKQKEQFILEQSKNATSQEHKEHLVAMAEAAFVDLEKDEHPHISKQLSDHHQDPWFVLHIGPPKTATTSIQCGLEKLSLRLAKTDGYHYLGGGCGAEGRTYVMPNGEAVVLRKQITDALNAPNPSAESLQHLRDLVDRAKFLKSKGRSMILSSELFGSRLLAHTRVMESLKQLIFSQEHGFGWNPSRVKIVLAYRHFVDWLPSYHFQSHAAYAREMQFAKEEFGKGKSLEDKKVQPFLEYADHYLTKWENYQEAIEEALFQGDEHIWIDAETFLPKDRRSIHPSWWLYQLWSMHFPLHDQVEVYDMHSPMNSNRPNDDIVTNFVCNMLPGAIQTCFKLMQLEDEIEQKKQANNTTTRRLTSSSSEFNLEEPDYEDLGLHPKGSWLFQAPPDTTRNNATKGKRRGPSMEHTDNGMNVRASHDFDAVMLIEDLIIKGDIARFNFTNYGPAFFKSPNYDDSMIDRSNHKGQPKKMLIEIAEKLLKDHNISHGTDERYYQCMDEALESRFWKASLTFVDLMYKQTDMLNHSALASVQDDHPEKHKLMVAEKETRYAQALEEHKRLFEKNKRKGKYCDISPDKLFQEIPGLKQALTQYSFKPQYFKFQHRQLPESASQQAQWLQDSLGVGFGRLRAYVKRNWDNMTAEQRAAAFYLDLNPLEI